MKLKIIPKQQYTSGTRTLYEVVINNITITRFYASTIGEAEAIVLYRIIMNKEE